MSKHNDELKKHDERMKKILAMGEQTSVHTTASVLVLGAEVVVLRGLLLELIDSLPTDLRPSFQGKPSYAQLRKEEMDRLLLSLEEKNPGLAAAVSVIADKNFPS